MMFWNGNGGWSSWTVALMWFGMLVFWALVAWGVVALVRTSGTNRPASSADPEKILKERLARGEITTDEYARLRNVIKSNS
ncbi:MAG: SHOCT domain-containing protein [Hyphomicrobiales bacterium]